MSIIEQPPLEQESEEELEEVASGLHGLLGGRVIKYLSVFAEDENQLGYALNSSTSYNFNDGLPKREPDASYVSREKMPIPLDEELNFAPDIAVEVVSKNDKAYDIEAKVKQYQQAGVPLIWIIYPVSQTVAVYHKGSDPILVTTAQELDGLDVLPGFKLKVSKLFK